MNRTNKTVCAIDFGTTYSGYAFGDSPDLDKININKEWGNRLGLPSFKTSSCVLTDYEGQLEEFGFDAESKYSALSAREDAQNMDLYRHFKMLLHNEKDITKETLITSTRGTKRPAFDIFTMALKYLKEHILQALQERQGSNTELDLTKIVWVITVPAIWSDKAKQFMREAAFQAGLIEEVSSTKLVLALEPEAAALYCKHLKMESFHGSGEAKDEGLDFSEGSKYMIIDAGGGTVDITVQEVLSGGKIKQLHAPTGGDWGGQKINNKFQQLMVTIFGAEFIEKYKKECPDGWLELEVLFEKKKRANIPDGISNITLPVTMSLNNSHMKVTGAMIEDVIKKYESLGVSMSRNYDIVINPSAVFELYHSVIQDIIPHVESLLSDPQLSGLRHIFLVGGFAESDFLKKAISSAFFKYVVLTPKHSITAVLRGAVIFGHNPDGVDSRIAKKTYGCSLYVPFEEGVHNTKKKTVDEYGKKYCADVFKKYLKKGEVIKVGESKTFISHPFTSTALAVTKELFSTDLDDVSYTDDPGVEKIAELRVPLLDTIGGRNRDIETKVYFGGTEIRVESKDAREGGMIVKTKLDFLYI